MKDDKKIYLFTFWNLILLLIIFTIFYLWLDLPIAIWAHKAFPNTMTYKIAKNISLIFKPLMWVVLAVIVALIGYFSKTKPQKKYYYFFSASVIIAYIICGILKVTLARYRPIEFFNHSLYGFHFLSLKDNYNSTPSGATITAFAALSALAFIVNKRLITILLLLTATLIGLARIIITQHYFGDVILGAYLGILTTYLCRYFFIKKARA